MGPRHGPAGFCSFALLVGIAGFSWGGEGGPLKPQVLWPTLKFDAYQAFQATAKGEVFFFRGDAIAAYPVNRRHELGQPLFFQISGTLDGEVGGAALDPEGELWLLVARFPRLFHQGREVFLKPLPFVPIGAWFAAGKPVAAVWPLLVGEDLSEVERWRREPSPWLLRWNGKEWESWLAAERAQRLGFLSAGSGDFEARTAIAAPTKNGASVALVYDHRVAFLDASGKPLATVSVPLRSSLLSADEATRKLEETMKRQGIDPSSARVISASRRTPAILGLTTCGVGEVILVVSSVVVEKGVALERWRVADRRLERVSLDLDTGGKLTLACGADGLYIAGYRGNSGRWWISRDSLEHASWREVEGAVFGP